MCVDQPKDMWTTSLLLVDYRLMVNRMVWRTYVRAVHVLGLALAWATRPPELHACLGRAQLQFSFSYRLFFA